MKKRIIHTIIILATLAMVIMLLVSCGCGCSDPKPSQQIVLDGTKCLFPRRPDTSATNKNQMGFKLVENGKSNSKDIILIQENIQNWYDTPAGCTAEQQTKAYIAAQRLLNLAIKMGWDKTTPLTYADFKPYSYSAYDWRGIQYFLGKNNQKLDLTEVIATITLDSYGWRTWRQNAYTQIAEGVPASGVGYTFQFYLIETKNPGSFKVPDWTPPSPQLFDLALVLQVSDCGGNVQSLIMWPVFKQTPAPGAPGLTPCPSGVNCGG